MTLNRKSFFLFLSFAGFIAILLQIYGCANIQRPMGGPRDKTPPKLLKATPPSPARHFNAKLILLDFDEYFKLNNPYQEITVSPDMTKEPEYLVKKRSLQIKIKDTLSKNTTYVINFGKSIADVNEGNILKNFTYVFSTGSHIDSLRITGNVKNVQTQAKEKDATVFIFPVKQDSAMFGKKKPAIYTTTDTAGNFLLSNLKEGDYRIYALLEKAPNKIYDNEDELIAFQKNTIHLTKDTADVKLTLFRQIPVKLRPIDRKIDQDGKLYFTFNKSIPNIGVKILNPKIDSAKIVDISPTADTVKIYLKDMSFDSVKVSFMDKDKPLDTLTLRKGKKETFKRNLGLTFNTSFDKLKPGTPFTFSANYPIETLDETRITMLEDSTEADGFSLVRDPDNLRKFTIKYNWRPDKLYTITFNTGTFTDIYGDRTVSTNKKFSLDNPDNYSQIILNVTVPDSGKSYVVQLTNDAGDVYRSTVITKSQDIVYRSIPTTKYKVKVIYDENRNGKWDTGNIKQKTQPENIWLYNKVIPLRTNWEVTELIDIPHEVRNP